MTRWAPVDTAVIRKWVSEQQARHTRRAETRWGRLLAPLRAWWRTTAPRDPHAAVRAAMSGSRRTVMASKPTDPPGE